MTNKELELIGQLTEVAMIVAELKAENKILKDINEKLNQALRKTDIVGRSEQLVCPNCDGEGFSGKGTNEILPCLSCFGSGERAD